MQRVVHGQVDEDMEKRQATDRAFIPWVRVLQRWFGAHSEVTGDVRDGVTVEPNSAVSSANNREARK